MSDMGVVKVLSIRDSGHDEGWLRDKIYDDPSILGLGELKPLTRERKQPQGGRLDLLLENQDDDALFEVELQLGPTDETHIIRTIEYWDNERKLRPKRSHTAVLVAEEITTRFFNVVHLLSMAVPIIGIQVKVVQIGEQQALHFTKVIDTYAEPEEDDTQPAYDEKHWVDSYPGTLECAVWYRDLLTHSYGQIPTRYFESYLSFVVGGTARVWVNRRKSGRAFFEVKIGEESIPEVTDFLNKAGIAFNIRYNQIVTFNVNVHELKEKKAVHEWLVARIAPKNLLKPAP